MFSRCVIIPWHLKPNLMMSPKLNLSTPFPDAVFLTRARYVLDQMTDNPNFANPAPPLTDLAAAIQAFSDAIVASYAGTHSMFMFGLAPIINLIPGKNTPGFFVHILYL